jgi:NADPH:quinone reductase-like Zn-dependent oxidoreductase
MVTGLGAHAVIDYTKVTTWNAGGNFDVILDCVAGESPSRFTPWLTRRGSYVNTLPDGGVFARQLLGALGVGPRVRAVMVRPDGDGLRWLNGLYEKKQLRAVIDEVFALDRLADAHRKSMTGRARGKIVVAVSE